MFNRYYARGDIMAYLNSEGFTVGEYEKTEDLLAAATFHSQIVALERSETFAQVFTNAKRIMNKEENNTAPVKDRFYGDDELF